MAAFRFRLETPLKLRRHAEEEARKLLAERIGALDAQERKLLGLREEMTGIVKSRRDALSRGIFDPESQRTAMGWMDSLKGQMETCLRAVEEAKAAVEAARAALVEARRGVKVLETLKDRRRQQWRTAENRRQENIQSDLAGVRWLRQERGE